MGILSPSSSTLSKIPTTRVLIKSSSDVPAQPRSDVVYEIDGIVNFTGVSFEVPVGGLHIRGVNFDVSQIICTEDNYTLFTSPVGGSGNLLIDDIGITVSGANSKVYDLTGATGNEALEIHNTNFNNCTSLGEITDYRQGLEIGCGRYGGTPELTMSGSWSGYRLSTCNAFGVSNFTAYFRVGTNLLMSGRFYHDGFFDMPSVGAFVDFSPSNFVNNESFILRGARLTRGFVPDVKDTGILPNIDGTSIKASIADSTGVKNTTKHMTADITSEVTTTLTQGVYTQLLGTFTVNSSSHFDMPSNGVYRLLTGAGTFLVSGDFVLASSANNRIDLRVTKSTDNGATFPEITTHVRRVVNNLAGGRDVAFTHLSSLIDLEEGDMFRVEVENVDSNGSVSAEVDSYINITGG